MPITLYCDFVSQPSRSLYILLKTVNCNFVHAKVDLRSAENYGEEFTKINRFQMVPVIDHDGFVLTESVAIIKYLAREGIIPVSLYPTDSKQGARVDEFMEWHHVGLRLPCTMYFRVALRNRKAANPKRMKSYEDRMIESLENFETKWLGLAGFDPANKYTNIAAWWPKVRAHFSPYYEETHEDVNVIMAKYAKIQSKI